jgi:hypothetical protein
MTAMNMDTLPPTDHDGGAEPPPKPSYRLTHPKLPAAFAPYTRNKVWGVWGYDWKGKKWTKPPHSWRTGYKASITDPSNWCTFADAMHAMEKFGLDGIGLVLQAAKLSGADLDHCINDSGSYTPLAAEVLGYGESYAEVSPSGDGIHIIFDRVDLTIKRDDLGIELYSVGRYFTVTGDKVDGAPDTIAPAPQTIEHLVKIDAETLKPMKNGRASPSNGAHGAAHHSHVNGHAKPSGGDFFSRVKELALKNLDSWVPVLHPTARKQATGGWRVSSRDLGRDLEEDLSYHHDGINDFGEEVGLNPIESVLTYGNVADAAEAAFWLCQQIGVEPASLGWRNDRGAKTSGAHGHGAFADGPDMTIVQRNHFSVPRFPLHALGPAREWVENTAAVKNAPVDFVVLGLLVAAAGMIGPKRLVSPWDGWTEPSILWGALVGQPSTKKSPAVDDVRGAIQSIERDLNRDWKSRLADYDEKKKVAESRQADWEQELAKAVKSKKQPGELPRMPDFERPEPPTMRRLWFTDTSIEEVGRLLAHNPGGLICWRDELSGLFGSFDRYGGSGADRAFWLESFGARPSRIDRVSLKSGPIDIRFNAVSLIGGIQPDRLHSMLLHGEDDGLASRPLYAWPDPVRPRRPTVRPDNSRLVAALRRLSEIRFDVDEAGDLQPRTVMLTPDAADTFQPWVEHKQWDAAQSVTGKLAGAVGKLDGITLRLAYVLELLSWAWEQSNRPEPEQVSLASLQSALVIIDDWVRPNLARVFGEASQTESSKEVMAVGLWLLKKKPTVVNARELRRQPGFDGPKEPKRLDAALDALIDAGWLTPTPTESPGRPRKDFRVNPRIFAAG